MALSTFVISLAFFAGGPAQAPADDLAAQLRRLQRQGEEAVAAIVRLAEEHPRDPAAVQAAVWLVRQGRPEAPRAGSTPAASG